MKKILEFCSVEKPFVYPFFGVYDFESLAKDMDQRKGLNTILLNKQIPISFSIGSNMDNNIIHVVNNDTNELIKTLVTHMFEMAKKHLCK